MANFQGSTEALAKEATWTSKTRLRERHDTLMGAAFANKAGELFVEQSMDGTNWDISEKLTVEASKTKTINVTLLLPYWRLRYVNGAEANTVFRISATTQAGGDS